MTLTELGEVVFAVDNHSAGNVPTSSGTPIVQELPKSPMVEETISVTLNLAP